MRQLNIPAVIIAFFIALGLMISGKYLYEKYFLKESLENKISKVIEVRELKIDNTEQPPTVYLRTAQIEDLQAVYKRVDKIVKQELGPGYRIVFLDKRTPKLTEVYEESQFAIQEAIATGCFRQMYSSVQSIAQSNNVKYRLTIDSSNIYLQLHDENGYLYEVIQRSSELAADEKASPQGGVNFD
ncbi:MAG: hypothetical protein ACPLTR_02835 [Thermacetogeniaceae bacterium]